MKYCWCKKSLQLNLEKTEILVIGLKNLHAHIKKDLGAIANIIKPVVKKVGAYFEFDLNFEYTLSKLIQSCFYHLH